MTATREPALASTPAEASTEQLRQVLVALMINDVQIGVRLDAAAPIGVQTPALLDVLNARLVEIGQPRLTAHAKDAKSRRGRWALCWVDGTALKPNRSLGEQGVLDGTTLWMRFIDDTEARIPVIEHVTSAIPAQLREKWPSVRPPWAARVGVSLLAVAMVLIVALLLRWRYGHDDMLASIAGGICALLLAIAAVVTGIRSSRNRRAAGDVRELDVDEVESLRAERFVADVLLMLTVVSAALGAALAIPGPLGAVHAGLGAAVVMAAAILVIRFTGRHIALCTAAVLLSGACLICGVLRMLLVTSAVTLLACLLMVTVFSTKLAPGYARMLASLRLPVFPSASGRWIFETRPDLPSAVVVAGGDTPTLAGPESVRNVIVSVDRVHSFLTGLVAGFGVLLVIATTGLADPYADQRWLAVALAGVSAAAVLLHARSYTDRLHSTILATSAVAVALGISVRFVVELWSPAALLVGCAAMLLITASGLALAAIIPSHVYSPVFKQTVEWVGYLLFVAPFPLAFWLMGVFAAIRYRS